MVAVKNVSAEPVEVAPGRLVAVGAFDDIDTQEPRARVALDAGRLARVRPRTKPKPVPKPKTEPKTEPKAVKAPEADQGKPDDKKGA